MLFLRRISLTSEGNIRALKLGVYIASAVSILGIYNFLTKTFLDPCCRERTIGEVLLKVSSFLSYIIGIAIIVLIFLVFIKQILNKFSPKPDISWRTKSESGLNMLFVAILMLNFGLLLVAQLPVTLIGCTECSPDTIGQDESKDWKRLKNINIPLAP